MNKLEEKQLQAKWDRILAKKGLSIYQPMTDNSDGEMAQADGDVKRSFHGDGGDIRKWDTLRTKVDGSDGFMDGHQITKVRKMEREVPEWALSDKEVQRVLLTAFPKLETHFAHKARAGRWARIIYLYYRMKQPRQIVAKEMKMKDDTLKTTIRNIERVEAGKTASGTKRIKTPPLQRPL